MYVILMRGIVEIIIKLENVISNTNISVHPPPPKKKKKKKKKKEPPPPPQKKRKTKKQQQKRLKKEWSIYDVTIKPF